MTSRAWGVAAVSAALLAVALSTGGAVYYLLFYTLFFMMIVGFLCALVTLRALKVGASLPKAEAVRGESVALAVTVERIIPLPVSRIALRIASAAERGAAYKLPVRLEYRRSRELRYPVHCPHRGAYEVGPVRAEVIGPFGLFALSKRIRGATSVLSVRPRLYAMPPILLEPGDTGPQTRIKMTEDAASPSGVRDWREGDGLKKIHWKLTMRRRELVVRTFEETARPDTLILPDLSPIQAIRARALAVEDAICEAALSMADAQLRAEHPVRMPLASSKPREPSGRAASDFARFLEAFAETAFDGPYPYEQLLLLETRRIHRTGGAVLITSRLTAVIADTALRMRALGMRILFLWVTEGARGEAIELIARMETGGVETRRIDPREAVPPSEAIA